MDSSFILLIVGLVLAMIWYSKWRYSYWKRKGVFQMDPEFLFGSVKKFILGELPLGDQFKAIYDQFKERGLEYGGAYMMFTPFFMPVSPALVKSILVKDFDHFVDRGLFINEETEPLSGHLVGLEGEKWRKLRLKLTPTFTSSKMKMMFETLFASADGLVELVDSYGDKNEPIDTKEVVGRFATDVIGRCAFGLECNSLKDPHSEFRKYGLKTFEPRRFHDFINISAPRKLLNLFKFRSFPKDIEDFFFGIVKETVSYREKNKIKRNDFLELLIRLKNGQDLDEEKRNTDTTKKSGDTLTMNELAAQCFIFFAGGFETTSSLITFALYELSQNPDVQRKLRKEIDEVLTKYNGQVTYQAIMEMSYLDKVLCETLRKYPPFGFIARVCTKPYKIPNTDITLDRGTSVQIAIKGIHMDPEYYPNPELFEPERFNEENKRKRPDMAWLPFGDGPRMCIGMRFGMLKSKVAIITFLRNYSIGLNNKTKIPLKFVSNVVAVSVEGGIWLDCKKKEN